MAMWGEAGVCRRSWSAGRHRWWAHGGNFPAKVKNGKLWLKGRFTDDTYILAGKENVAPSQMGRSPTCARSDGREADALYACWIEAC